MFRLDVLFAVTMARCRRSYMSVEERAERIQRDLEQNAKDLDARDPRSTVHAEMGFYGIGRQKAGMLHCWLLAILVSSPRVLSS